MRICVKRTFFVLACVFLYLAAASCASASRTVVVGVYSFGDYMDMAPGGRRSGYSVEFLCEIAKYSGWKYKFIDYNSFDECFAALRAGRIDILPAVFWSTERERKYLRSEAPMGATHFTLIVRSDDLRHAFNDIQSFQGMRVGVTKSTIDEVQYIKWCKENGLHTQVVEISSTPDLLRALDKGGVDAVAVAHIGANKDYRVVAEFTPMNYYFMLPKDRGAVKRELDRAMNEIALSNADFQKDLRDKYFSPAKMPTPVFTRDEQTFIRNSRQPLEVALDRDNAPFSKMGSDGVMSGILPDLYARYAQLSGLAFRFVPVRDQEEAVRLLKSGSVSIVGQMQEDRLSAETNDIILTNPFIKLTLAQITREDTKSVKNLAVPYDIASALGGAEKTGDLSAATVKLYDSASACFAALKNGEADAMYCDTVSANYLINRDQAEEYTVATLSAYTLSEAAGVLAGSGWEIFSVLNRCIRHTGAPVLDEMVLKNVVSDGSQFVYLLRSVPAFYVVAIGSIACLIIVMLLIAIFSMLKNSRAEKQVAAAREREKVQEAALAAAERASESKTEFLSNISHDMRTPLNGILGFADMAARTCTETAVRDCLEKIRISGGLLLNLVNDTLEITRIDSGKFAFVPEPTTCLELLNSITVPIRSAAEAKGVSFIVHAENAPKCSLMLDRLNMQKIFLNLLSNAVKFTPAGGTVEFDISARQEPDGKISCHAVVRDNGIGIGEEFMPRIFEPFAQEHSSSISGTAGTGLGLAIVKRLVGIMGGRIEVNSVKGAGSEFTVFMLVERAADCAVTAGETPVRDLSGRKVLLCEDNAMNTEIAKAMLESRGLVVVCAADGREGVQKFAASQEGEFSAVFMDIRMPVMDGREAARAIRAMNRSDAASVPIIAMTADAFAEDVAKCREAGMNSHVPKPIDPRLLFGELDRLVK